MINFTGIIRRQMPQSKTIGYINTNSIQEVRERPGVGEKDPKTLIIYNNGEEEYSYIPPEVWVTTIIAADTKDYAVDINTVDAICKQ